MENLRLPKIEDADLIGYTKARSEGFTAKKNDNLVAIPPRKMKITDITINYELCTFYIREKLKDSTALNLNIDNAILLPFVREAQKLHIETALGTDLNTTP